MPYNYAIERIADAGHGSCGASPAPKAHRSPHSAVGVVRRSAHRGRYVNPISGISRGFMRTYNHTP